MSDTMITWEAGVMELKPVQYWIETKEVGKWWWQKTEYYLHSEFASLGPFESPSVIRMHGRMAGMTISPDIKLKEIGHG